MKRNAALLLAVVLLVSCAASASALTLPNSKSENFMDYLPAVPTMTTSNDGQIQTVTLSEPVQWIAAVWNWNWVGMEFTDDSHTTATVDLSGFHTQPGHGAYAGTWYNDDGSVGGTYAGTYGLKNEGMDFAYDMTLADGSNAKYDSYGIPATVTVTAGGTEYYGNGASDSTTFVFLYQTNFAGTPEFFPVLVTETYADGSSLRGRYAMNGDLLSLVATDANEVSTWLYHFVPGAVTPTDPGDDDDDDDGDDSDNVIFDGSFDVTSDFDWSDWTNSNPYIDLAGSDQLKSFTSGQAIAVTFAFPYEDWASADWSHGPMLLIQPSDGDWEWGQFAADDSGSKTSGVAVFSYDQIAATVATPNTDARSYAYYRIYAPTQMTITKVEVLDAE